MNARTACQAVLAATVAGDGGGTESDVHKTVSAARLALEMAGLSAASHVSLIATLERLQAAYRYYLKVHDPMWSPVFAHARGEPSFTARLCALKDARGDFEGAMGVLAPVALRPDGYSAKDLRDEAGIGFDLWQTLRTAAQIRVEPGQSQRRFSNQEVARLIRAAKAHKSKRSMLAAEAWQRLLEGNLTVFASNPV